MRKISLVLPVYNEAAAIPRFFETIEPVLASLADFHFEFVFVNDGSSDETLSLLLAKTNQDANVVVIDLSRNFGKEAALTAGLAEATGDAVIPMDVDLQDPPEVIPLLIEQWQNGFDVVLARRSDRSSDSFLKRKTAGWFYAIHNRLSESPLPENVGDFRLLDRQVVNALKGLPERRRFMKGLLSWLGFRSTTVDYVRQARCAGEAKFSGWRLWNLAIEGITGFSTVPLRIWTYLGLGIALLSFLYLTMIIIKTLWFGVDVPGYASILVTVLFLGGIQLIGIGILGEYIGRIYMETKQRPVYLIRAKYQNHVKGTIDGGEVR